jgi:uncharacterized protein (TIGR02145 family)/uncharacterized repeat protein (TIGR02543 family)
MNRPVFTLLGIIVAASLLFVFCTRPNNPFEDPENCEITLVVKDLQGRVTMPERYIDTVGNAVKIGVCPVLFKFIDSAWIQISRNDNNASLADADSFKVFKSIGAETDTQWYVVTFKTPGERTVKATAFLNNREKRFASGSFIILGRTVEITTQPASIEIDEGVPASFTVEALGASPLSYQWKHGGVALVANGTSATYKITETVLADSGTYTCVVKDIYQDSIESDTASLTIKPATTPGPTKVTGLGVISRLAGTLAIKWNRAIRTDSYIVLRSSSKATGYVPLDTIPALDTMYTDKINSAAFYYEIKAYNSTNNLFAAPSDPVYSSSVNKAPQWQVKDTLNIAVYENTKVSLNFADSVSDENGDSVWLQLASGSPSTDSIVGMSYVYTPLFSDSGSYIVTVLALDGVDTGAMTMRVHVKNSNRLPAFDAGKPKTSYLVKEDDALSFPVSATDPDGDAVTYAIRNVTLPRPATATLSVGVFSWACLPGDMTNSSVEIGACDYKDTTWVKVNIAAGKVNATPTLSAVYNNQAVARDGVVIVNENDTMRLAFTVTDPDSGQNYVLKLLDRAALSCGAASFDSANNKFFFVPSYSCVTKDTGLLGELAFVVTDDGKNGATSAPLSDTFRVSLKVINTNRPPVFDAVPATISVAEGSLLTIGVHATDPDNDNVTITANGGPFTIASKAIFTKDTMFWTPGFGDVGSYNIVFDATDGDLKVSARATITVTNTNRKPLATPTPASSQRNGSATITLLASDPDGDALSSWQITKDPLHGTQAPSPALPTILYTPAKDYIGKDTIWYTVSDGKVTSDVGLLIITVDSSKIAPQISKQPQAETIYSGAAITLNVETNECFPTPTFKWYKAGATASVCSTQTFTKSISTAADSGNYYVIVENVAGKVTSSNAQVTVNTLRLTIAKGTGGIITAPKDSSKEVTYGIPTVITAAPIAGYDFVKWAVTTGKAAMADSTSASTTITLTVGNATVKANFAIKTYQLTVNAAAGGTITAPTKSPVTVEHNVATTVKATPDAGYNFKSWTIENGSPAIASRTIASTTITLTSGDAVVTANFELKTYQLTVIAASPGGIITAPTGSTTTENHGVATTITAAPSAGYSFGGWTVTSGTTSASIAEATNASTTVTLTSGDATVKASWVIDTFTVNFDSKGGSAIDTQRIVYNTPAVEPSTPPTKGGYVFAGWYANSSTTLLFDFATPITASRTLYAGWTPVYTVIYNVNGGVGSAPVDITKYRNGNTVTVLSGSGLNKTNYAFTGWNTQADTLGATYQNAATFTMGSANVTLYAKWTGNNRTVIFDAQGGSLSESQRAIHYGTPVGNLPTPLLAGCLFKGWFTEPLNVALPSDSITKTTIITEETVTYYARWAMMDGEGNEYKTVRIGSQTWMAENLRSTKYQTGGDIIPDTSTATWMTANYGKYCYYSNTTNADSIKKYGALYNWYAVNTGKLAPPGWHVPTDADWTALESYLITSGYNWDGSTSGNKIAKALAARTDWKEFTTAGTPGNNLSANNASGFSALPAGYRGSNGYFFDTQGSFGCWWSATEFLALVAYSCDFSYGNQYLDRGQDPKVTGLSVRLVKDN